MADTLGLLRDPQAAAAAPTTQGGTRGRFVGHELAPKTEAAPAGKGKQAASKAGTKKEMDDEARDKAFKLTDATSQEKKATTVCPFLNTARGCNRGAFCNWLHPK